MEEFLCGTKSKEVIKRLATNIQLQDIVNYTNNLKMNKDKSKQLENFKNLLLFINNNNIKIGLIDAEILLSSCPNFTILFDSVIELVEYIQDDNIDSLVSVYSENKVRKDRNDSSDYLFGNRFNKNDLDLIKLYFNEIKDYKVLTLEEEKELATRCKQGDQAAKDKLVCHNLKLVASAAKSLVNHGLSYSDLIQEGNLGLLKAVEKFDVDRECKFSTYAMWWIRQSMLRAIPDIGQTIRIPVHLYEVVYKVKKETGKYIDENFGETPSVEYLSEVIGKPVETIKTAIKYASGLVSLSTPVGEEEDAELESFIEDDKDNIGEAINNVYYDEFRKALNKSTLISEREREILKYRFGFYDNRIYNLEEIGKILGVTRERVRQIETKAIRKLTHDKNVLKFAPEGYVPISKYISPYKSESSIRKKYPEVVEEKEPVKYYEEYPMTMRKRREILDYYAVNRYR